MFKVDVDCCKMLSRTLHSNTTALIYQIKENAVFFNLMMIGSKKKWAGLGPHEIWLQLGQFRVATTHIPDTDYTDMAPDMAPIQFISIYTFIHSDP